MSRNAKMSDVEDLKEAFDRMAADIADIKKGMNAVGEFQRRLNKVEESCKMYQDEVSSLGDRVDQLEQYTRKDNVIISGIKATSYADATSVAGEDEDVTDEKLEESVLKFFDTEIGVKLAPCDINITHYLPAKVGKNILVKFTTRKAKLLVLKNRSKLKGKNIYISEHLTKRNNQLFYRARMLCKDKRISRAWIRNSKLFVRTNGEPNVAKNYAIVSDNDFQRFGLV